MTKRKAFTLIELLVVVAIIALLLSILLPSLSGAREQGKRAKCLAHLNGVAKAMYSYSNDDSAEQIIPIHRAMRTDSINGVTISFWQWRTVNWFAWGGRSGQKVFKTGTEGGFLLADTVLTGDELSLPHYDAKTRPLTIYMSGDVGEGDQRKMDQFSCPSDTGYPEDALIDDSPLANANRSCYETLGNSFRASLASYLGGPPGGMSRGAFALGPWGHRVTTLQDTGRLVLAGEPTWFNMIGTDDSDAALDVKLYGWHKKKMVDNLAFCDGSARSTKAEVPITVNAEEFGIQNQNDAGGITRGSTWRLDVYPVGGAIIWGNAIWQTYLSSRDWWPWKNHQDNFR